MVADAVGIVGAVTDGIEVVVVGVPGSWHMYGGVGSGASEIVVPGCAATHACFHDWLYIAVSRAQRSAGERRGSLTCSGGNQKKLETCAYVKKVA